MNAKYVLTAVLKFKDLHQTYAVLSEYCPRSAGQMLFLDNKEFQIYLILTKTS